MWLSKLLRVPKFRQYTIDQLKAKKGASREANWLGIKCGVATIAFFGFYGLFVAHTPDLLYDKKFGDDPTGFGSEQKSMEKRALSIQAAKKDRELMAYGEDFSSKKLRSPE